MEPNNETNQLLEHILESNNDDAKQTHALLENLLEQTDKEDHITPLLENQLEMQGKIVDALDREQPTNVEVNVTGGETFTITGPKGDTGEKGEKGDKGDKGEKGDKGDKGEQGIVGNDGLDGAVGHMGPRGPKGDKGDRGLDGIDGTNGKDGKDGKDGKSPKADDIVEMLKNQKPGKRLPYSAIDGIPTEFGKSRGMGGTGYLREITDVEILSDPTDGYVLGYDTTKKKWTPSVTVTPDSIQTLTNKTLSSPNITGNTAQTGGIPTVGGDGINTGAIQLKPANPNYNWYSWVNKEVGGAEGIALQRGAYPAVVSTPLAITAGGVLSTPTGTISPQGYERLINAAGSSSVAMVASTTYYFGNLATQFFPTTSATVNRVYMPRTGSIKRVMTVFRTGSGTPSSAETISMYVRVDNTTDYTIATDYATNVANNVAFASYAVDIPITAGSYFNIKMVTPAWTTVANYPYVEVRVYIE